MHRFSFDCAIHCLFLSCHSMFVIRYNWLPPSFALPPARPFFFLIRFLSFYSHSLFAFRLLSFVGTGSLRAFALLPARLKGLLLAMLTPYETIDRNHPMKFNIRKVIYLCISLNALDRSKKVNEHAELKLFTKMMKNLFWTRSMDHFRNLIFGKSYTYAFRWTHLIGQKKWMSILNWSFFQKWWKIYFELDLWTISAWSERAIARLILGKVTPWKTSSCHLCVTTGRYIGPNK
jgi:hypothetical protein